MIGRPAPSDREEFEEVIMIPRGGTGEMVGSDRVRTERLRASPRLVWQRSQETKWHALLSAGGGVRTRVLDTADIVRDGDISTAMLSSLALGERNLDDKGHTF